MTRRAGRPALLSTLSLAVGLSGGALSFAQSPVPATPPGSSSPIALTATVRSVDAKARTLEVVTGVGPALRVMRFSCGERVLVKTAGGTAPLAQLKPGDLVRVEYAKGAEGNAATTIEALAWPAAGGAR